MRAARALGALPALLFAAALLCAPAAGAAEAPAPALAVHSVPTPTNFDPADSEHNYRYETWIANEGGAPTDGSPVRILDTLPRGLTVEGVKFELRSEPGETRNYGEGPEAVCETETVEEAAAVACTVPEEVPGSGEESAVLEPAEEWFLEITVGVGGLAEGEALANTVAVEGGGSPRASETTHHEAGAEPAPAGFAEASLKLSGVDGQPATQAGAHPFQFTTSFFLNTRFKSEEADPSAPEIAVSGGDVKDIPVVLPPGLVGNPTATPRCDLQGFNSFHSVAPYKGLFGFTYTLPQTDCPNGSAVGYLSLRRLDGPGYDFVSPIFNLVPPPGMPAQFGFHVANLPVYIDTEVRPSGAYKVVGVSRNISEVKRVIGASITLWGTPGDPAHERLRGDCLNGLPRVGLSLKPQLPGCGEVEEEAPVPFLRLPTSCGGPLEIALGLDTWAEPGSFIYSHSSSPAPEGCGALSFEPTLRARPTTDVADSPTGLDVDLHIPQPQDPAGTGEADLRRAAVALPEGVAINPSGANGLEGCSEAEAGFVRTEADGTQLFDDAPADCPGASRIGEVEVSTPLLDEPLKGGVYAAAPHANPFDSLLAIYIAVEDPKRGIVVKLAGKVVPDPQTGQLTTVFDRNPQVPFEDFKLRFREGATAPLRTPPTCGTYETDSRMTPWSAPESGPPAAPSDAWAIARSPGGGPCATDPGAEPNAPSFEAGTAAPIAGAYSPLVVNLRREDGSQEFERLTLTPPPGLLARLAGVPYCPEAALAAAAAKAGRAEEAAPSCPAASRVGSVQVAAGAGPAPYYAQGTAYLAGPYKGAPLSLAAITPAAAGPYDLGTVVVRSALEVNPVSAQVTAATDPIPRILAGVPLDVREVSVRIDRPGFALNPTNCETMAFAGQEVSTLGQPAPLYNRFQVLECGALGFKPKLKLRLRGPTRRGAYPALHAVYEAREGDADLARMVLRFPRSEFIEQAHFRTICTRAQYAAGAGHGAECPKGAVYGRIRAFTPLLEAPLEGPVYLRSSSHNLPDVVFALHGQVDAEVSVRIDSVKGGLRASIEHAPDVPVSRVVLDMQGGRKGLFVNSRDICAHTYRADARLDSQSGRARDFKPVMRDSRCKKHKPQRRRHRRH